MPRYGPGQSGPAPTKPKPKPRPVQSEVSTGIAPAPQAPSPEDVRQPKPRFSQPNAPEPNGKPVPILQQYGYHGSLKDFSQRLEHVDRSYRSIFGAAPSPGLAFDLVRSPVQDFVDLFKGTPQSSRVARLQQFKGQPAIPGAPTAADLKDPKAAGKLFRSLTFDPFNEKQQAELSQGVAEEGARIQAQHQREHVQERAKKLYAEGKHKEAIELAQTEGLGTAEAGAVGSVLELGASQIVRSLTYSPVGLYKTGGAVKGDVVDIATGKDLTPSRTAKIGKETVKAVKRDFTHPLANPGYVFMDALGLASAGTGTATRVLRAAEAAGEGAGIAGTARTLASRPTGGMVELRKGDLVEHELQSENRAVALAQRFVARKRNERMALRHEGDGPIPGGLLGAILPDNAETLLDKYFSSEAKLGRLSQTRKRLDHAVAMDSVRRLEHVAGWSVNTAKVFSRLPKAARKGLTRGEQKAIQVLSTDDPNPLQVHRDFHEWAIEAGLGDIKAHQRQLVDLELAEKVLTGKPRKRFTAALDLTRKVMGEQERIKIDQLGLGVETAEKRVIAPGEVLRGETLKTAQRQAEDSFYLPYVSKALTKKKPSDREGYFAARSGPYGVPKPRELPELRHSFTGKSIQAGDFRIDATGLAAESYARTVRAATVFNHYKDLLKASTETRRSEFDVPIRESQKIPDKLRTMLSRIDDGEFTAEDAANLRPGDVDTLLKHLYPNEAEQIEGVRWIDSRLIGDVGRPPMPKGLVRTAQLANEPFRVTTLFLRPAYALNALGNTGMGLMHQGVLFPANVMRAVFAHKLYGKEVADTMDALVGEGRMRSFVAGEDPLAPRVSRAIAQSWSFLADQFFRRAALIHELRRQGFRSGDELESALFDEANKTKLLEAKRRANKAMVEFDNLTWYEKNLLRHLVFVYPWVSRSAVWSLRTLVEHPIQSDLLIQLGREAEADQTSDPLFAHAPEWFKRTGYIPVGYTKDGRPKVINPTSINTFATLGQLMTTGESAFVTTPFATTEDLYGPAAKFFIHASTGRDDFGNEYPNGKWIGAANEVLNNLPQFLAHKRSQKQNPPGKKLDLTNKRTLVEQEHSHLHDQVFSPGFWNGYGTLMAGGLTPRAYDPNAAASRYWENRPLEERHKHERALVQTALQMQAGLLKAPLPKGVKNAVTFAETSTWNAGQWAKRHGRSPTDKERLDLDIALLEKSNKLDPAIGKKLRQKVFKSNDPQELSRLKANIFDRYAGTKELRQWDADVRMVYSFRGPIIQDRLQRLVKLGLAKSAPKADQQTYYELGRQYLAFVKDARKRNKELEHDPNRAAELRLYLDEHDKPIKVGDKVFASPAAFDWAMQTEQERQTHLNSLVTTSWKSISAFDKKLLGKNANAETTKGWNTWQQILDEAKAKLPPGESYDSSYKTTIAKYVDKYYAKGFYKDYLFAHQPNYQRLPLLKPIQQSPNRETWNQIFAVAATYGKYLKNDNYSKTATRAAWKRYVDRTLKPWAEEDPKFKAELGQYGSGLLGSLLNG